MHQAQDNFVAEIDGAPFTVHKGEVFSSSHPLVKLDNDKDGKPRGLLWKQLEDPEDEPEKPAKSAAKVPPVPVAAADGGE